jgi:GT2 family glycosyltransferase
MALLRQVDAAAMSSRGTVDRPRLSIVIVSHNCRRLLLDCLGSLEAGTAGMTSEVIVIDNASSDGTVAAVEAAHPSLRLIAAESNLGFAHANNIGLEIATGRFVLLLNPDTVAQPGALRRAVEELEARPRIGMLGCKLVRPDGSLDHAAKRGFPTPLSALGYFTGLSRLRPRSRRLAGYTAEHLDPDEAGPVDAVNGAFMLVRREALDEVGSLDEDYWLYMEDLDWCYRFWQADWPVLYWPGVEVVHVKGGSSTSNRSWRTNYAFHRGMWVFYRKHYRGSRPVAVTALVWAGIWTKLGVSAARSLVARRLGPWTSG